MALIEEVRSWLVQEQIGLLSKADLIALVDEKILELNDPPYYLTAISLKESLAHVPQLDLVKDSVGNKDCAPIARIMLQKLNNGEATLDDIGLYSLRMHQLLSEEDQLFVDFLWIDDEVNLMSEGVKDKERSERDILETLEKISAL